MRFIKKILYLWQRSLLPIGVILGVLIGELFVPNSGHLAGARRLDHSLEDYQPYLEYQIYKDAVVTDHTIPPVLPGGQADYAQIYDEHGLCDLVQSGAIDEVWIWTGDGNGTTKGHMWEWTTSGPGWSGSAPDCGKVVTTMAYNYLREVDVALESYHHRLEGLFTKYFTCDFSTATWPWAGSTTPPFSACGSLLSNRYGFVARPFAGNSNIGACGDAHHPPNILDAHEYDFSNTATVSSMCSTWSQDGSAQPEPVNCQAWGCTHWGFHQWWMQNVPGIDNINRDRSGELHKNWWAYLFGEPTPPTDYDFLAFLPLLRRPGVDRQQSTGLSNHEALSRGSSYATAPHLQLVAGKGEAALPPQALISPRTVALQDAAITRTVFVLYYPGYGGTPRTTITLQTQEVIGLLKEAMIYHGYELPGLQGIFIGQDGGSYAGQGCNTGTVADNIHIRLTGLRTDTTVASYQVDVSGGRWATPCNPISNWLVVAQTSGPGQVELYFKPFRNEPAGTLYSISLRYQDGTTDQVLVVGGEVRLNP